MKWSKEEIFDPKLISQIFSLLYRQYDEINEVKNFMQYVLLTCLYSNKLGCQGPW